jgi:non-ribosomal peptide synthetase-like protein
MSLIDLIPAQSSVRAAIDIEQGHSTNAPASPQRLQHVFERQAAARPGAPAVEYEDQRLTYADLEARANQLAHLLIHRGIGTADAVGILLDRSAQTYVALLAVLKCGAAFVPIDPSFPAERVRFIAEDAGTALLLTCARRAAGLGATACPIVELDSAASEISTYPATRPEVVCFCDAICYVIYTSGTTGRPKGVAVTHSSICNFLTACGPIYGYRADDRVYQGMTIAFDFSIEEIWPTLMAGATIVAGPSDHRRLGPGLAEFLIEQNVTVMCCVPTLLATLDRDVPSLRLLLVGGEACPRDLVSRWSRPGRRMLNTYGPTETTVTATWTELTPGRPVTIGRPLPTYSVHILDDRVRNVAAGEVGEICIGGPGVARGYVKRPDLTAAKFIPDPFAPQISGAKLYRTGDLGRITSDGEIEYLGRIDDQVKIRGHRIELSEIESVLMEDEALRNAVVVKVSHAMGDDLAAYVTLRVPGDVEATRKQLHQSLRTRLPAYMVPAYIEVLDEIPMLASGKADRSRLGLPTSPRVKSEQVEHVAPATPLEQTLAAAWAKVFGPGEISADADFFLDLGGHSLFAAAVVSHLRQSHALRGLAISDLYANPSIRSLAQFLETKTGTSADSQKRLPRQAHSNRRFWGCGLGQMASLYLFLLFAAVPTAMRLSDGRDSVSSLLSAALLVGPLATPLLFFVLPVVAKWMLIGRFRPGTYPLWGWYYLRFWLVRRLLGLSPLDTLAGSPMFPLYARLLGARVGKGCHIASGQIEAPDLIDIGNGAEIGYGATLQPFVVEGGRLHLGRISIGREAFIGVNVLVLPETVVGDRARVTDQSLIARSQHIPGGQTWSGSPSMQTATNAGLDTIGLRPPGRRTWPASLWCGFLLSLLFLELLPTLTLIPTLLLFNFFAKHYGPFPALLAAIPAGPLFVLTVCLLITVGKRLVMPRARAGIFPVRSGFGLRKWVVDKLMDYSLSANNTLYATLYALPFLRLLGARIGKRSEVSTLSHVDPDLLRIEDECFVADDASIGAATYYNGYVALGPAELGRRCFVGNSALVPANTRLGDNCLLGVQSLPPGEIVQPGTSWLGSPSLFLPRRQTAEGFDESLTYRPPKRLVVCRLAIEFLRVTVPATLLHAMLFTDIALSVLLARHLRGIALAAVLPAAYLATGALTVAIVAAVKWLLVGQYRPRVEPNWSHFVWRTELITGLYESAALPALGDWLMGTPFMPVMLRLFGSRIGQRVYLATSYLTEFDLVQIGDDAEIEQSASLQTHLFEDRVMKMSTVAIGAGATIGPRSVVLYDATVESEARLAGLSLVMKGETLPAGTTWHGIPAQTGQ